MVERLYNNIFLKLYNRHPAFFSIFLVSFGYLIFNVSDAANKYFSEFYGAFELIFWTSLFSLITMVLLSLASGLRKTVTSTAWHWHVARGLLSLIGLFFVITAVKNTTLANFYAIVFLSPITCVVAARLFFGDSLGFEKLCAVILGFIGILVVVQPGNVAMNIGILASMGCVLTHTSSIMLVRKMGADEPKLLFGLSGSCILVVGAFLIETFGNGLTVPPISHMFVFAALGVACAIAATAVSTGFQIAPSTSTVAPFHYIQIIGGIAIGYIYWNEVPTTMTLLGAAIVIASGCWVIKQERGQKSPIAATLDEVIEHTSDIDLHKEEKPA